MGTNKKTHHEAKPDLIKPRNELITRQVTRAYARGPRMQAIIWTTVVVVIAAIAAANAGHVGYPLLLTTLAFAVLTLPYFLYGISSIRRDFGRLLGASHGRLAAACVGLPVVIYVLYALGTTCFTWSAFVRLLLFVSLPTGLMIWAGAGSSSYAWRWQDLAAVFLIWVPFDTGLLNSIWAWPEGEGAYIINTSLAVSLAVTLFSIWRRLPGINFRWSWNWHDLWWATLGFLGFSLVALPLGFATGFITFNPSNDLIKILAAPLGIFFFIAVPEELLFRGLVQNLLGRYLGRPGLALLTSSIFFGATHLNNEPVGDWRFFMLATIAGGAYGLVYSKTRSLLAPALTHTAVDVIWLLLLHV